MGKEGEIYAGTPQVAPDIESRPERVRNGIHLLPIRDETVTLSHVREIMDEEDAPAAVVTFLVRSPAL